MRLFNNNFLVKLEADKTSLGNGLNIKETRGKRDIVQGTVVEIPEGLDPHYLGPNDVILFPLYAATEITIDGNTFVVVNFEDIILKK